MIYLISLATIVAFAGYAPQKYGLQQNNYKNYMILCGFLIAALAGLRSYSTGSPDTYAYTVNLERIGTYDNFRDYYDRYLDSNDFIFSEAGFYYCLWLLSRVTVNGHWLVFISSAFITWATCRFIYKNSSNAPLSLMIYVCLGLFSFNMDCMRQSIAMSICMLGYEYVKERKLIKFLIVVSLATLFHKSGIFFLPVYVLPILKNTKGNWLMFMVALIAFVLSLDVLIPLFNDATNKAYATDSGLNHGGISVLLIYALTIVLTVAGNPLNNKKSLVAFCCVLISIALYLSRYFAHRIVERASFYYFYFTILYIPDAIDGLHEQDKKWVKPVFIMASLALFAYRIYVGLFKNFNLFFFRF